MENGQSKGYPNKFTTREVAAFHLGPGRRLAVRMDVTRIRIYRKEKPPIRELRALLASRRAGERVDRARGGRAAI